MAEERSCSYCHYYFSLQARVALYNNQLEVVSIVFDAVASDRDNWFAKSRLIYSPWNDLDTEEQNYFSILGDSPSGRSFYINKDNSSCYGDVGWFMASSGKNCSFESRHSNTVFMYSKLTTSVNWNDYGKKCQTLLFAFRTHWTRACRFLGHVFLTRPILY